MTDSILILGASTRAAACSALRAGRQPVTADLFADADLVATIGQSAATQIEDYPAGLVQAAESAPPGPWLYTGALENQPQLVGRIAGQRELWGNGPGVLRQVRDPEKVAQALEQAGIPYPAVATGAEIERLPRDGTWLAKPNRGAAGMGIVPWEGAAADAFDGSESGSYYLQQNLSGLPRSAVFLGHASGARLLGATEQLIGTAWCGGRPYQYCGSIGPLRLSETQRSAWQRIGECLARRFELRGLFGVDAIENNAGIWPVEVNPRYTASVEILERAAMPGAPLHAIALHMAACQGEPLPPLPPAPEDIALFHAPFHGKAILFAPADLLIETEFTQGALAERDPAGWPLLADIPRPGTRIVAGHPVLTAFGQAASLAGTLAVLKSRLAELRERLSASVAG